MVTGSCQCQAVKFTVDALLPGLFKCYCEYCRKISGGAFQAVVGASGLHITAGQELVSMYNVSGTYERHFCSKCHTFLYGQVTVAPGIPPYVSAAALDADAATGRPIDHLFVRSKVAWHTIGEPGTQHDAYPPM